MEENEIQAAGERPEDELAQAPVEESAAEPAGEVEAVEAEAFELEADGESVSAEQLLGDQEQPAADADTASLKAVLEAIVYILSEPMPAAQIAQALDRPVDEVEPVLRQLAEETARADRGIFIREVAGGYQMATKAEHHEVIRTFVKNLKQPLKLSQAALETLAVIAYKQPITMPEILEIRGVQGGGVVKTLIDRKLITTAGRKNVIGKPMMYKTTKEFLTQFGLRDVGELPSLKEFEDIRRQSIADEEFEGPTQQELAAAAETALEGSAAAAVEAAAEAAPEAAEVPAEAAPEAAEVPAEAGVAEQAAEAAEETNG